MDLSSSSASACIAIVLRKKFVSVRFANIFRRLMEPAVRLPLDATKLGEIVTKACDWAAVHGMVLRTAERDPMYRLELAPFTLLPSPFPRDEYAKVTAVQRTLNLLIHRVAYDERFLEETLRNTMIVDDFTSRLFRINKEVLAEGRRQPLSLGILRCDYMLDSSNASGGRAKQVEMNTISSSFSSLATQMTDMHRYVLSELGRHELIPSILENRPVEGFARALVAAWRAYDSEKCATFTSFGAAIVFLVEPFVRNIGDHKLIDCAIKRHHSKIRVLRRTMADFVERGKLLEDGTLMIDAHEVAVVYYRDGYAPDKHVDENYWDWRLKVERSRAIKCPSIQYHLAGVKKIQQRLADPKVLNSFLGADHDQAEIERVADVFTGLYSLDQADVDDKIMMAANEQPHRFVLKPQREGGGNNVYGAEISRVLRSLEATPSERSAYILMDRIVPPTTLNYLVRPPSSTSPELVEVVSELGIYGIILGCDKEVLMNEDIGHLLRTKPSSADEGGVIAGYACLDAMFLA